MIVEQVGYKSLGEVIEMYDNGTIFSIFFTHKKTSILIIDKYNYCQDTEQLYYPKRDRLPYKLTEGKKIANCKRLFKSSEDDIKHINPILWNNETQIMSYTTDLNL